MARSIGRIESLSIVILSLLSCFLIFVLFKTNDNIENLVKSDTKFAKIKKQPVSSDGSDISKVLFAPIGVASMGERIFLELKMKKFLMGNENIYGVRNVTDEKDGDGTYGTGFLIDSGVIATANHVTQPPKIIEVINHVGWKKVSVLGDVSTKDIAFIRIYPSYFSDMVSVRSVRNIFDSFPSNKKEVPLEDVMVGMKCMAFGVPRTVIGELYSFNKNTGEFSFLIHVDPEGCSGTAVYMMDGSIIGLFQSLAGIKGGALDISEVKKALDVYRKIGDDNKNILTAVK